jgi:hypothetical protein
MSFAVFSPTALTNVDHAVPDPLNVLALGVELITLGVELIILGVELATLGVGFNKTLAVSFAFASVKIAAFKLVIASTTDKVF